MKKQNQKGAINVTVLTLVVTIVLLIGSIVFAFYAYSNYQDYKNNTNQKINVAVKKAINNQTIIDAKNYAIKSEFPLTSYISPEQYGSLNVNYPKTWSAYVDDSGNGNALVDGYFNPGHVPSSSNQNSTFALRIQVLQQSYSSTLQNFQQLQQSGNITSAAYALPKVSKVVGVKLSGQINGSNNQPSVTMVVLPLRSYTLEIWTQGNNYLSDFNNNVLNNFTFSP